jgi:outer membrane protein
MKNISTFLSVLCLVLIGVLFYLHFSTSPATRKPMVLHTHKDSSGFRIAFFDIDSLQSKYEYFKDVSGEIKTKEASITSQLNTLQDSYQKRIKELQSKGPTMNQSETEAAQREFAQMQRKFQERQMNLEQDLKKSQIDMMSDVRTRIEDYLKDFNQEHGYAFILSYEPGLLLYYRDSTYDITDEVIAGLNQEYKTEKAAKDRKDKK